MVVLEFAQCRDSVGHPELVSGSSVEIPKQVRNDNNDIGPTAITKEGDNIINWEEILKAVKPLNHSLEAFLRSAKPVELKENNLLIAVFYPFHLARLNDKVNKELVLRAVKQVLGENVTVEFRLGGGKKAGPV